MESSGIDLPLGEIIKSLEEDGAYKYLGVLEADNIKHNKIKKEIINNYVYSSSGQVLSRYCELDKRGSWQFWSKDQETYDN